MKLQLIRHAALWLEYGGSVFLIDPMLGEPGAYPPIVNSGNERRNPLVGLPGPVNRWLKPDAVIVTHFHNDHWDDAAVSLLPKDIPLFSQIEDGDRIGGQGFTAVTPIQEQAEFRGVRLIRTRGRHGTGEIGRLMGPVSGFILQAPDEPVLYIAGDTIWCEEVQETLDRYQPETVVINAGEARFVTGCPITMNDEDISRLCVHAPKTKVVAVHMDTINHCHLTRDKLRERLEDKGLLGRVLIPSDGEFPALD
ncbi:L-ascorbate metabolism protein UlaG, beta-lactamase superfamily [Paenibacillus sophorae]|uniref:L-ascorbate metabolism protein UlaG, beta-lactamase superfamily n=1 Tax=Paenibacillus sophorae TaxID=1333845 RepID=A0A1H8LEW2_9BACL|nr:MBL fold metallo-hydrolase [Paenibacillus sophorae]QWU17312.1 MBL fold metallo-hydrolase [Paenibacillus sophorae]SEO03637.1 L-ascorbate metabolism protein UlaG, beta-lactamase superfamily [Paenibacillus sophorae]